MRSALAIFFTFIRCFAVIQGLLFGDFIKKNYGMHYGSQFIGPR
jgi:hypothetical protein